jgi:hypothetical protein
MMRKVLTLFYVFLSPFCLTQQEQLLAEGMDPEIYYKQEKINSMMKKADLVFFLDPHGKFYLDLYNSRYSLIGPIPDFSEIRKKQNSVIIVYKSTNSIHGLQPSDWLDQRLSESGFKQVEHIQKQDNAYGFILYKTTPNKPLQPRPARGPG